MNNAKIRSLIGFATKAGKVVFGCEMTVAGVRKHNKNSPRLMICASDASENTKKRIRNCSAYHNVPMLVSEFSSGELSAITGKLHSVAVLGITDEGFVKAIQDNAV